MSRGASSLTIIFVIVITLAAIIAVLLVFADTSGFSKSLYCSSLYNVRRTFGYRDVFCEDLKKITVGAVDKKTVIMDHFTNKRTNDVFLFNSTKHSHETNFSVPSNIELGEAGFSIRIPEKSHIRQFADNSVFQSLIFTGVGSKESYLNISNNVKIVDAEFDVSGKQLPAKVDMVFVIDTSNSMANEWNVLCTNLDTLDRMLRKIDINASFHIFAIGTGGTQGDCMDGTISQEMMESQLGNIPWYEMGDPVCISGRPPDCVVRVSDYDDYSESWGLATLWVLDEFDEWRENTKRIIFPISDSDPTGGGRVIYDNKQDKYLGDAQLSGNEDQVIDKIIANSQGVSVFPIYGDKGTESINEGFNLGEPESICMSQYSSSCGRILGMMKRLAQETSGNVSGYRDLDLLKESILQAVTLPYPVGVRVEVGNYEWYFPGRLNETYSPVTLSGPELVSEIQSMVYTCSQETCIIPINVTSYSEGAIWLDNLDIQYITEMHDVTVLFNKSQIGFVDELTQQNPTKHFNVTSELLSAYEECQSSPCTYGVGISTQSEGVILIENLRIIYEEYPVEEEIIRSILDCWRQSSYGMSTTDIFCHEIVIPDNYRFTSSINESSVTEKIRKRNLCHLFENDDFGCGEKDNLVFAKQINSAGNVLVEYNSDKRQVVVS